MWILNIEQFITDFVFLLYFSGLAYLVFSGDFMSAWKKSKRYLRDR